MPFSLCLPANEIYANRNAQRRAIGDPGATERFSLPNYLYIIVLKKDGDDWIKWQTIEETVTEEDWMLTTYGGTLYSQGNLVYQYTGLFDLLLSNQKFEGRVYAMASTVALSFSQTFSTISDLDELLALTFDASDDDVQENIQNIYSTPYNYDVAGHYYCSFSSTEQRVPHVSLMLYHVAAKVDIIWNVEENVRIDNETPANGVRLTYLGARRLFNGDASCFQPLRNTVASLPATGYDINDIVTSADEGLWWEGRTYFYTIPYIVTGEPGYFPLQLLIRTNDSEGTGYQLTLKQPIDTTDIFVPWIRGNIRLTQALSDMTDIKIGSN